MKLKKINENVRLKLKTLTPTLHHNLLSATETVFYQFLLVKISIPLNFSRGMPPLLRRIVRASKYVFWRGEKLSVSQFSFQST